MTQSTLRLHRIVAKRKLATADFARRDDFDTVMAANVLAFDAIEGWPNYLIYSLGSDSRTVLFSNSDVPLTSARGVPFLYEWQRTHAQHLLEVPVDRLQELGDASCMTPTFILSLGRSGSTLLAELLRALGQRVASEPDSFTSMATAFAPGSGREWDYQQDMVLRACVENVRATWGASPYIKLRGVCSFLSGHLATVLQDPKFIFVLRERRPWAMSHARAFGARVDTMLAVLLQTVSAYDSLVTRGCRPTLIWYEDLCLSALETLQAIDGLQLSATAVDTIRTVMAQDVQANTPLARSELQHRTVQKEELAEFDAAWERCKPTQLLERHGLWRLL
jgi:hypothetical protein